MERASVIVEELPELDTEVALYGSTKQEEIGGGICLAVAAGIAIGLVLNG